jgi:hypothetical protein
MKPIQKKLLPAALLGALTALPVLAQAPQAPTAVVEVAGISITKLGAGEDDWGNPSGGTALRLWIGVPGKGIVGGRATFKGVRFTDDKRTDLIAGAPRTPGAEKKLSDSLVQTPGEGKFGFFTVSAPSLPAKGATRVLFDATMTLRCGSGLKTVQQSVALKKGSKITVGLTALTISEVKPEGEGVMVKLSSKPTADAEEKTLSHKFFDAEGQEIESSLSGGGFGGGSKSEFYTLARKVPTATVKVSYYTKLENVTVPMHVEAGLGLTK